MAITSPTEINACLGSHSTIVLNCSFIKETGERVNQITWTKKNETEDKYITIIEFYQLKYVYIDPDMKKRSTRISFDDSFPSAILNIIDVQCKDNGQYECTVEYINSNGIGTKISTKTSVYIQGKNVSYLKIFFI